MKLVRLLLFPFAILYDVITSIRNYLFDKGILSSTFFSVPIIVVGNLSVGGTGKTPQIEYLVRLFRKHKKVGVLSRGYGRKTKGFLEVNTTKTADEVGDEPLQYAQKFSDCIIAVDENRVHGIQKLLTLNEAPEIILLDDAYQHRKVTPSFAVLLTKYDDLFSDDFLLPTGNLRENKNGAKRADIIIVTKSPFDLSLQKQAAIVKKIQPFLHQKVFFSGISYAKSLKGHQNIHISKLKEYEVLLVTGIANPTPLTKFLQEKEVKFTHLKFPDHHSFSSKDIQKINNTFAHLPTTKKMILTTEKDYVRLKKIIPACSYLEIETQFLPNQQEVFDKLLLDVVQ